MATMDPRLILQASQGIDVLGAMGRGNALARDQMDMQKQNALAGYYRTNADGLLNGDPNALAGLMAAGDPQSAMRIQDHHYQRGRDARSDAMAERQEARLENQYQLSVQQHIQKVGEAQALKDAENAERLAKIALGYHQRGDQEGLRQFILSEGGNPEEYPWDDIPITANGYMSWADITKASLPPQPLSGPGKVQADINSGILPAGTPLQGSGVTVNNRTDPAPATGYRNVYDEDGNLTHQEPIPGGPAAQEAAAAAGAAAVKAGNAATSTDIITTAAGHARAAAQKRNFGSFGQGMAARMPWTDAAEVARQVEVLKSNAKIENLQAMRDASPTGGALGSVSDNENQMLAAKAGALDPSSPNFLRDLDDFERTLLRTVHGHEAGDRIYEQTRVGDDGWENAGNGIKIRVK